MSEIRQVTDFRVIPRHVKEHGEIVATTNALLMKTEDGEELICLLDRANAHSLAQALVQGWQKET